MRSWKAFVMVSLLSALVILNVRQAYLYQEEVALVEELEELQKEKYEENRRIRTGIAILESPERIDALAEDVLGLEKARPDQVTQIVRKERTN
ncbi:MAG: hypothetical protein PQJ59_09590 [Spirochaetales bacterium]|nr:hypothetical protein [Spirochaetales bacterium]